ncbi:MAG TPA: cadherin repeat domain-containing protein, partial [Fibrobacter sp.]|nr:cadherin repeat domain-containing protein [Fibrobacter sp.]
DPLTYTVLSGNEENLFVMEANGKITVRASNSLDYDTMDSIYTLKVMVSDPSGLESTATIYINLKNVNEPPVWNDAILEVSENEPVSTSVGVVSAVDEDRYDTLIYKIVGGSGEDLFEVNPNTGRVTTKIVFDYEDINSYTIDIEVSDGEFKLVKTFTVSILDVNEPPVIDDSNVDIDENVPRGTVVTTVTATDVDSPVLDYTIVQDQDGKKFRVDPNGVITVDGDLDYEEQKTYKVRVVVTDGFSNDTALVTISINDLNEAPTIPNAKFYVAENATSAVKIGSVKYTDPENDVLVFVVLADTSGKFKITSSGDVYLKAGASLDYESVTSYTIKVIGTDPGGLSDTANVEIVVTNVIETAEVKIITVTTIDSIYQNPDTLYINTLYIDLEWTEDGDRNFGDTILVDGYNIIIKEFCVEHKDFCGYDTLIVYVNTKTPGVVLYPEGYDPAKVSGITIVEQKKKGDSAFYVNRNENQILVTVTDPGIDGKPVITDFKISADLQTVKVPASVFETLGKVADAWRFETSEDLTYSSVNEEQKASYETTVKGAAITVSYDLHKDSTTAQISYLTVINGKDVIVSYVADRRTGKLIKDAATDAVYSVGYTYVDKKKNEIFVSYSVDSKGQIIKDPKDDSILYHLTYDYTNKYGNTAKKTIDIVLDKLPPVVQIISPVNGVTVSSVSLDVRWTVDGIEQDTLNLQSLNKGINLIIRAYRDKAGNETADTVMIMMKNAKDIVVSMQEPLIEMTDKKREEFQRDDPPAKDDRFGVSILNVNTNTEEEVLIGKASGSTVKGSGEEPYPGLSGSHLGPTLEIDAKLPSLTAFGGLASLDDLIEADGMIAIEAGGGWDRTRVTVSDYVSKYCSEEFKEKFDFSDPSATPLYKINFGMSIWIYSSLGSFIDLYKFSPELQSQDYVNAAGVVKMYFELKPGVDGHLRDHKDRLLATSAYLFKTEIKMTFTQQCTLPDQTPVGTKKVVKEDFLSSFGFKRPQ